MGGKTKTEMNRRNILDKDLILSKYEYDSENGLLISKKYKKPVTARNWCGYVMAEILRKKYRVHRIIYFLETGEQPDHIDHIDGNKSNNQISNLRACTHQQNGFNNKGKGVSWEKRRKHWRAQIMINQKQKYLGSFKSEEEAKEAYNEAAIKYFGEFANLNEL